MTRVALLTPYAHPVPGGISTFVDGLARLLRRRGHEVAIFAGEGGGDIPSRGDLGKSSTFGRHADRGLKEFSPEVLHAHSHWYTLAAGVQYVTRFPSSRLVFSFHTTTVPRWRNFFARLLSRSHVVTFVSCVQLADLRRALHLGGDLRILHPATDLPKGLTPGEGPPASARFGDAYPRLAFLGPLEYEGKVQGVVELVRSLYRVQREFPRVKLLVVGDGRFRGMVEREGAMLGSAVEITGYMEDTGAVLDATDIYCHISHQEGLPLALLEAMAHGRAVVATPVGGIPEIIDDSNGLLVVGEGALSDSLVRLARDPEIRRKLGHAAKEAITEGHTWDARWPTVASCYGLE